MSRSKKGKKDSGHEYWSKRPGSNAGGAIPGASSKCYTNRVERRLAYKQVSAWLKEIEDDESTAGILAPRTVKPRDGSW